MCPETRTITVDRGYTGTGLENQMIKTGVRHVVIPRKGKPGKTRQMIEHRRGFAPPSEVAHRLRGPDEHNQTGIRMGPNPDRWH